MALTTQDFSSVLKSPFADKQWPVNLMLQGAVLVFFSCFLIGLPFLSGFMIALIRQAIKGDTTLPNWELGQYFKDGIKTFCLGVVYNLPLLLAWLVGTGFFIISIVLTEQDDAFAWLLLVSILVMLGLYAITFLYSLVVMFAQQAYLPLVALGAPFKAAFEWRDYIVPYVKANIPSILLGLLFSYFAYLVASLGMIVFFVGYFFTMPYAFAVIANISGLIYRRSTVQYPGV